jgi:hypothetical protein
LATLRRGDEELPLTFTNHFLAHLQVAVHRRFKKAGGFFLTGTYADGDGKDVTVSYWVDPTTALAFEYDVTDENGERMTPVELDFGEVDAIMDAMARPVGVHHAGDLWVAFREKL